MIYSQFIIHFNDKSVLLKLLEILKLQGSSYLAIKEAILRNLNEISKHYSIRGSILKRKLLSKLMKSMHDHLSCMLKTVTAVEVLEDIGGGDTNLGSEKRSESCDTNYGRR